MSANQNSGVGDQPGASDDVVVEFVGEEYVVAPGSRFSFGRAADLVIDDNPHLHRVLGVLEQVDGLWWLHNAGSAVSMELVDKASPSKLTLKPGATMALVFEETSVRFQAGSTMYELTIEVPLFVPSVDEMSAVQGTKTVTAAELTFTPDQMRCVLVLAEPQLLDPSRTDLPTNREAARRLDWKLTRFNRKLDNVCAKLAAAGVAGLVGDQGALAMKRRERLVSFAVGSGLVSSADLHQL